MKLSYNINMAIEKGTYYCARTIEKIEITEEDCQKPTKTHLKVYPLLARCREKIDSGGNCPPYCNLGQLINEIYRTQREFD